MHIWIEAEEWTAGEWTPENDNSDVVVTLDDGSRWSATFFTFTNIALVCEKNKATGECLGGRYFWTSRMVLVDRLTRREIEDTVRDLIATGEFEHAFENESPQ